MKFLIQSDLHLEFFQDSAFMAPQNPGVDALILAGDICTVRTIDDHLEFFKLCNERFKDVYYIAGNHESYSFDLEQTSWFITNFLLENSLDHFHYLDNTYHINGDVLILGTTLWTDLNKGDPYSKIVAMKGMNDYRVIKMGKNYLMPNDTIYLHDIAMRFIKDTIESKVVKGKKIVVISHHPPTWKCVEQKYKTDPLTHAFVSEQFEFIADHPQIDLWCSAHIHSSYNWFVTPTTRLYINARGYCLNLHSTRPHKQTAAWYTSLAFENKNFKSSEIIEV